MNILEGLEEDSSTRWDQQKAHKKAQPPHVCVCVRKLIHVHIQHTPLAAVVQGMLNIYLSCRPRCPRPPPTHTQALTHRRRPLNSAFFKKKLFCHSGSGDECRHLFFWSAAVSLLFARRSAGCRCLWIRARFFWEGEQTLEQQTPPQPPSQWSISTTIRWLRSNTLHCLHARVNGNYRKEGF